MKTSDFVKFEASAGGSRAAGLLKTHKTSLRAMYEAVALEVTDNLPGLIAGGLYLTEQLCGPDLWGSWPFVGQRRAAGMCLAFLVDNDLIPLEVHKTMSGKGPTRYKLPRTK
jgi:hypothetical protein